jgi:hypothetical protein
MLRFPVTSVLVILLLGSAINVLVLRDSSQSFFPSFFRVARHLDALSAAAAVDKPEEATKLDYIGNAVVDLTRNLCSAQPLYAPLRYDDCKPGEILNVIPLFGGMTNALKMVLLGTILSYEEGRCFYVNEETAHLNPIKNGTKEGFITKYMEPIGLPKDHPYVKLAYKENRVQVRPYYHYWNKLETRRTRGRMYNITSLGYDNIEGHMLKKKVLRRMWRLLPKYREATCTTLMGHELGDEFMSFSVRRGDKSTEKFVFTPLPKYIKAAEMQTRQFGGKIPKIFVATDDCRVMKEFRQLRPDWTFISECDKQQYDNGFVLRDIHKWSDDHQEDHFRKFFVEMFALATSKVFSKSTFCLVCVDHDYQGLHSSFFLRFVNSRSRLHQRFLGKSQSAVLCQSSCL